MKRVFFIFVVCMVLVNFALADYGDVVSEDEVANESLDNNSNEEEVEDEVDVSKEKVPVTISRKSDGKKVYTTNFYVALGLGFFAVLLVLYIVFIFLRGPTEKWGPRVNKEAAVDNFQKPGFPLKRKVSVTNVMGQQQAV